MLRFHTQTAGVQLTAQQPEVNMVRVAIQGLAAVLGGTQSLHTNSFDEAIALPTEKAARLALRTQQVLAYETDVCETVDPFAGSYVVESLTDERRGGGAGAHGARSTSWAARSRRSSTGSRRPRSSARPTGSRSEIDSGERVVVGVNKFTIDDRRALRAAAGQPGDRGRAAGPAGEAARRARRHQRACSRPSGRPRGARTTCSTR